MIKTLTIHRQFDNHFRLWFDNLTIIAGAGLTGCPENAAFPMTETPPPGKSSSESDDCDEAVTLEYNNDNDDNYNMDADMMMLFIFFTCPIHLHQSFSEIFPYSVTPGYITDDGDGVGSPGRILVIMPSFSISSQFRFPITSLGDPLSKGRTFALHGGLLDVSIV